MSQCDTLSHSSWQNRSLAGALSMNGSTAAAQCSSYIYLRGAPRPLHRHYERTSACYGISNSWFRWFYRVPIDRTSRVLIIPERTVWMRRIILLLIMSAAALFGKNRSRTLANTLPSSCKHICCQQTWWWQMVSRSRRLRCRAASRPHKCQQMRSPGLWIVVHRAGKAALQRRASLLSTTLVSAADVFRRRVPHSPA